MRFAPLSFLTAPHSRLKQDLTERYGLLLAALVAAFAVQGVANPGPWEQVAVTLLLALTLLLSMWAANVRLSVRRGVFLLAVLAVASSIAQAAAGDIESTALRFTNMLLVVLAPPAVVVGVIRSLKARGQVTLEAVFGVLCLYILVGMFFAFLYGAIGNISGNFFANGAEDSVAHTLYFSFTTLTTVGYGDFTASSNLGHTLSTAEALIGQIYLVTVVSVIVGNLGRRRPAPE
jgi:Ion channel